MVLVDTSIWIRGMRGEMRYQEGLDRLLAEDQVVGHELIYGELFIGDRGGRLPLLTAYEKMLKAKTVMHTEVVAFARHHHLHGRGVGWIDMHLLASARLGPYQIWTADPRLEDMAREFDLAFTGGTRGAAF